MFLFFACGKGDWLVMLKKFLLVCFCAVGGKPNTLAGVRALVAAAFGPSLDGPAEGLEGVMLAIVAAERDAQEGVAAVLDAPCAHVVGNG